jgi:hypothetical protein
MIRLLLCAAVVVGGIGTRLVTTCGRYDKGLLVNRTGARALWNPVPRRPDGYELDTGVRWDAAAAGGQGGDDR